MLDRRELMKRAGMAALLTGFGSQRAFALDTVTLPFDMANGRWCGTRRRRPMIGLTERPPQLETPFAIFNDGAITPNNAFFVRYHLADVPYDIRSGQVHAGNQSKVDKPLKLSLKDIKKAEGRRTRRGQPVAPATARGFSTPAGRRRANGNGAMGNARWRGVPLKAVPRPWPTCSRAPNKSLQRHGWPVSDKTPDFVKGARHRPRPRRRGDAGLWH